ncbi:cell wall anchor [Dictyobacter sp. S3.2.2.5]|uniref:Cell wall anchor n=1 Tax=Dictyobacter halimunensis TaxID=3026934 RepID=A0ABQ6FZZ1_9CHLR|nr:cell wall anchor [Dictyobacter sp. S3.2.2.5]
MKGSLYPIRLLRRGGLLVGIMFLMGFFGLGSLSTHTALADTNTSYVRVIHASPFVGTADVFVDGKAFLNSFQFASVTDYAALPAGNHKVQISLVGKGVGAAALTKTLPVETGKAYTVAAIGATPQTLDLQVFVDDNKVSVNQARVRVYHLIPDAGQINATIGEDNTIQNMGYRDDSSYIDMNTGPCDFKVTVPLVNQTLSVPKTLAPNTITSVFAVGMVKGNPKAQLVTATTPGIPGLPQTGAVPVLPDTATPGVPLLQLTMVLLLATGFGVIRHFWRHA